MWGLAFASYVVAVFHRSSLSVTGLAAQERFSSTAASLALLGVLQLAVYAAFQVPVGVLLDKFGARRMVAAGALLMAVGQLVMAVAPSLPAALLARALVGIGDAMTFISVLRIVIAWFPPVRVPVFTQLTGMLGQVGQVVAAYPLVLLLSELGWTRSYLVVAAAGGVVAGVIWWLLPDAPPEAPVLPPLPGGLHAAWHHVRAAWRAPGTRLGMWTHFVTQYSGTVFVLLWGFPFLVVGQGLSPVRASALLSVMVVMGMVLAPVLGWLAAAHPTRRSLIVLSIVTATAGVWTVVLLWPGRAPLPVLIALVVVLGAGGPGSMLGFEHARTANPPFRLGVATGLVNAGGFVAALTTILLIGLLLDVGADGGPTSYDLGAFKLAFASQYLVWGVGLVMLVRTRRGMVRQLAADGVTIEPFHRALHRRVRDRRN